MPRQLQYPHDAHVIAVIPPPTAPEWGAFSEPPPSHLFLPRFVRHCQTIFSEASLGLVEESVTPNVALLFEAGVEPVYKLRAEEIGCQTTYLIQGIGTN